MASLSEPSPTSASPPTSPLPSRGRQAKSLDPFYNMPHHSPSPSSRPDGANEERDEKPDSLFQRIVMSPLLFTSFIISLVLVERRDRAWRVSQNSSDNSFWSRYWTSPEPYQDPVDKTRQILNEETAASNPATDGNLQKSADDKSQKRFYYTQKKHRKMAKYQLEEAWNGMAPVTVAVVGTGVVVAGGAAWAIKSFFG